MPQKEILDWLRVKMEQAEDIVRHEVLWNRPLPIIESCRQYQRYWQELFVICAAGDKLAIAETEIAIKGKTGWFA